MATITDYFNKAGDGTTTYPVQAVVSQARAAGDTVLVCQSLAGWATGTPVHFSTFNVGSDGAVNVGSQTDWKGIVVNNTITQLTRLRGASDSGNAIGDIVELNPTIGWLDDLITGLLVAHNQNGTLKSGSVGATQLASSAVTSTKIGSSAVTNAKIASDAVTTAKIADDAVTADKIDFTTMFTELYSGDAITSGSVTLNQSYSSFDALIVSAESIFNPWVKANCFIWQSNFSANTCIPVHHTYSDGSSQVVASALVSFSDSSKLTVAQNSGFVISPSGGVSLYTSGKVGVVRVVGLKLG